MKTEILEKIASVVSEVCEVSVEQIRSHSKCAEDVDARCIFVHYCKVYGISNYTIMRYLHRQRTCVIDRYLANYFPVAATGTPTITLAAEASKNTLAATACQQASRTFVSETPLTLTVATA